MMVNNQGINMSENTEEILLKPEDITEETIHSLDGEYSILELVRGQKPDGTKLWAYVQLYPSKYMEYMMKVTDGEAILLFDYGEVITGGYGDGPTDKEKSMIEEKYGADHNFEQKLKERIETAVAEMKKRRHKRAGVI